MDQESKPIPTLRGTRDLFRTQEEIVSLGTHEALPWPDRIAAGRKFGRDAAIGETTPQPPVHAFIARYRTEFVPRMIGWDYYAIGPITRMRDQTAARRSSDQGSKCGQRFDFKIVLKVAERGRGLDPRIEPKNRSPQFGDRREEGII